MNDANAIAGKRQRTMVDEIERLDDRIARLHSLLGTLRGNRMALSGPTPEDAQVQPKEPPPGNILAKMDRVNDSFTLIIDQLETEAQRISELLGTV